MAWVSFRRFSISEFPLAPGPKSWNCALVIESFGSKQTENLWNGKRHKLPVGIEDRAANKLSLLAAAVSLDELRIPPSNHLEALEGGRAGQHSIRINSRYRLCFEWNNGNPRNVEITDYH